MGDTAFARAMRLATNDVKQAGVETLRQEIKERGYGACSTYTTDINTLEKKQRQPIFVMDDMMTGGRFHDYITETNLFGRWPAWSGYTEDEFTFFNKNLGKDSFPIALGTEMASNRPSGAKVGKIWGQIYEIRPQQFKKLDFLRENGYQFLRQQRTIRIPNQKTFLKKPPEVSYELSYYLDCWMYVGIPEYWNNLIDDGYMYSPVRQITYQGIRSRPWLDRYYVYENGKYK